MAQLKNGYIYDSIWALAKALDDSIPILKSRNLSLDDYSNSIEITNESLEIADVLNDSLSNVSFNGVSVSFFTTDYMLYSAIRRSEFLFTGLSIFHWRIQ